MLIKLLGAVLLPAVAYIAGIDYVHRLNGNIRTVDGYILLLQRIKSAVEFSSKDIFRVLGENENEYTKRFTEHLLYEKSNPIAVAIQGYSAVNSVEGECIGCVKESLILIEGSSDKEFISDIIEESLLRLRLYQKQIQEEYRGKIKIAPSVCLVTGIFAAVLII